MRCPDNMRDVRLVSAITLRLTIYYIEVNFIGAEIGALV